MNQPTAAPATASINATPQNLAKEKYRSLKRKFKFLVYENECYQEELRNLQRRLLKLSRDKNFLLDRLMQYEKVSDSSDDSDPPAPSAKNSSESPKPKKQKKSYPSSKKSRAKQPQTQPNSGDVGTPTSTSLPTPGAGTRPRARKGNANGTGSSSDVETATTTSSGNIGPSMEMDRIASQPTPQYPPVHMGAYQSQLQAPTTLSDDQNLQ